MASYQGRGLHGQTVERLGALIVHGSYGEGMPLFAEQLESDLDVSKTVVREALKVLAAKGLVESRQKRGTVVRPRHDWNLLDADVLRWQTGSEPDVAFQEMLAELRGIVEPAAARLAAVRRTEADLELLTAALEAMAVAGDDVDAMVVADVAFHRTVLDATHNELLSRMEVMLSPGLKEHNQFVRSRHKPKDPVPVHRAVYDAIAQGDPDLAETAVHALLDRASKDFAASRKQGTKSVAAQRRRSGS
jgi:GntR family galactonate operon transcriptional repressor